MRCITNITLFIEFSPDNKNCMFEIPDLGKPEVQRKKQTCSEKQKDKPLRTADITIDAGKKII
jgi:hypothetical protein